MSKILVDTIDTRSGTTTLTLGSSNLTTLTKASGVSANFAGVKMADLWRQNADTAISAATETVLASNWEQADTDSFSVIGSAMTQSSGIFTFPETGIYLVIFNCQIHSPSQGATYAGGIIQTTTDNGTYSNAAEGYNSIYHSNGYGIVTIYHQFDVTSTSTHKVKFVANCEFASDVRGNTGYNRTCSQFIRLGDT